MSSTTTKVTKRAVHPVDEVLPASQLAVYGFQHVLAFYAGAVIVPILLAGAIGLSDEQLIHLINADLFTCGIASIIQSVGFWKVGVKLPLLQGVTFTAVAPMIAIGTAASDPVEGLQTIYGSVIVAGLFTFLMAPYFGRLIRFFPPVVTGSVIAIIGIALLPVAANDAVGFSDGSGAERKDFFYALGTLALIVAIQRIFRGFMATIAVLAGLVVGTAVAFALGDASFDSVGQSDWAGVTTPFFFGAPEFAVTAIISMIVVMLITAVETTGDVFATGEIVQKRMGKEDVSRALRADGLATSIGGVLNSFPYTCFAENVGLVRLTGIRSRWVVATAGAIMIVIGVIPKAGAVAASIPHSVLGGAAIAMFATVAVVGFQMLSRVDFNDHRNVVIVATSVGLAMLVTMKPNLWMVIPGERWSQMIFNSGITLGSITAIALNLLFFHVGKNFGPAVAGTPSKGVVRLDQVNAMPRETFVSTFSGLFQDKTWPVELAYDLKPFADTPDLRRAFSEGVFSGSDEDQRALIAAYPDLGSTAVADGAAGEGSIRDQAALGLHWLGEEEAEQLAALTAEYRERFGFPLIVAVRDADSFDRIMQQGRARMDNSVQQERVAALVEVAKVANYRFDDLVADANPIHSARNRRLGVE